MKINGQHLHEDTYTLQQYADKNTVFLELSSQGTHKLILIDNWLEGLGVTKEDLELFYVRDLPYWWWPVYNNVIISEEQGRI